MVVARTPSSVAMDAGSPRPMTLKRSAVNWLPVGMKALQEHVTNGLLGDGVVRHHTSRSRLGDISANIPIRGVRVGFHRAA
jgi:hypothetical protein